MRCDGIFQTPQPSILAASSSANGTPSKRTRTLPNKAEGKARGECHKSLLVQLKGWCAVWPPPYFRMVGQLPASALALPLPCRRHRRHRSSRRLPLPSFPRSLRSARPMFQWVERHTRSFAAARCRAFRRPTPRQSCLNSLLYRPWSSPSGRIAFGDETGSEPTKFRRARR